MWMGPVERALKGDVAGAFTESIYATSRATPATRRIVDALPHSYKVWNDGWSKGIGQTPRYASGDRINNVPPRMTSGVARAAGALGVPLLPRDMSAQLAAARDKDYEAGRRYIGG